MGLSQGPSLTLAATTSWIIKDGLGHIGGLVYTSLHASQSDASPKRHRFHAAILLQATNIIDLLIPLVPAFFLPLAAASNVGKNVAWLATGASRAAMNLALVQGDNLGDVTAKSGYSPLSYPTI